jgi:Fe-S cluster assembly iron-binding protein IscA
MSIFHWVAGMSVKHTIETFRLRLGKPQGFDEAIEIFIAKHAQDCHTSLYDRAILQHAIEKVEVDGLLLEIAKTTGELDVVALIANIDGAVERLKQDSSISLEAVLKNLSAADRARLEEELGVKPIIYQHVAPFIEEEWKVEIKKMWEGQENRNQDPDLGKTISNTAIKHETSIISAYNILTDCFRVSVESNNGDYGANFSSEYVKDNQAERHGCILHFQWSGPVISGAGVSTENMKKDILYEQDKWRYIIAPGTSQFLTFIGVSFSREQVSLELSPAITTILNCRGKKVSVNTGSTCDFSSWQSVQSCSPSSQRSFFSMGQTLSSGLLRRFRPKRGSTI